MLVSTHAASICKRYTQYNIVYREKQREETKENKQTAILGAEEVFVLKGTQQTLAGHPL